MKVTTTIELDCGTVISKTVYEAPDSKEESKPGDGDGSTGTGNKEEDEGDVKPYN